MPNKRKVKARESARNDYTPVKPSSSQQLAIEESPSPAERRAPLRPTVCEADINQDSPEQLLFSPGIKPTQNDIEWAWKSPIGRSQANAGPGSKRRLQSKTPVQKTKRGFKSYSPDSPVANLPSKRKLIKHENEGIEYLSTLTSQLQALTEHCDNRSLHASVTSRAEERNDEAVPTTRRSDEAVLTTRRSDEAVPTTTQTKTCDRVRVASGCPVTEAKPVSSLTALLEDDDGFDLFQCSQFIEEKLTENPDKVIFSPIQLNGGSRICSAASPTDRLTPILKPTNGKSRKCPTVNDRPMFPLMPNNNVARKCPAVNERPTFPLMPNNNVARKCPAVNDTPTSTLLPNHSVARNCSPMTDKLAPTSMSTNGMARKCPAVSDRTLSMAMPTNSGSRKCPLVTALPTSKSVPNKETGVACTLPVDTLVNNNSKVSKIIMKSPKLLPNMCGPKQPRSGQVVECSVDRTGKSLRSSSKSEPICINKCIPTKAATCPTQNKELVRQATEPKSPVLRPAYSQEKNSKTDNSSTSEIDDDSFDAVLLSFCDQNFELLSETAKVSCVEPKSSLVPQTAASSRPIVATVTCNKTVSVLGGPKLSLLPQPQMAASRQRCTASNKTVSVLDEPKLSLLPQPQTAASRQRCTASNKTVSVLDEPKLSLPPQPQTLARGQRCTASNKTMNAPVTDVCESRVVSKRNEADARDSCKDEDFLQPELLDILESIETTIGQKSVASASLKCTPEPLKCTPEEIEMKRVQARLKLQRKKHAMLDGICRLPNPYLKGKLQS